MPLLQFETTVDPDPGDRSEFTTAVRSLYADVMQTGTGHIAIAIRSCEPGALSIGRQTDDDRVLFLMANIRAGRSGDAKREIALRVMDLAGELFGVPQPNMKVVFTEHEGPQFMGYNRVGSEWSATEETTE